jgi:hypothetical protein
MAATCPRARRVAEAVRTTATPAAPHLDVDDHGTQCRQQQHVVWRSVLDVAFANAAIHQLHGAASRAMRAVKGATWHLGVASAP